MNRKSLLALARKHGYAGAEALDAIKAYFADPKDKDGNALEFEFPDGFSIEKAWANTGTRRVSVNVEDPNDQKDDNDVADDPAVGRKTVSEARMVDARSMSAGATNRSWQRKAYDRNAATGKTVFDNADSAEVFGASVRLAICPKGEDYAQKATDLDICRKFQAEYSNPLGGALVPDEFSADIIRIREKYGVAASVLSVWPMLRDTAHCPRELTDVTVYAPGEGVAPTESEMTWDQVRLTAQKWMTLSRMSSEIMHDAAVSVADRIANSIAYAYAKKEDECVFTGDGSSTFFGMLGIPNKFRSVLEDAGGTWTTDANKDNLAGLVTAAGNTWAEITLSDIDELVGRLPSTYEGNAAFYCHKAFFWNVLLRLDTLPTATATTIAARDFPLGTKPSYMFRGYPVKFVQVMPRIEANSHIPLLFGDLNAGVKLGRVSNSFEVASSDQRYWDQDLVAIRSKQRIALNVHDVGNYHATEASRVAGPIVALATLNS